MECSDDLYDKTSPESILAHARKMLGKSLSDVCADFAHTFQGKGVMGQSVELYHFKYSPNSNSLPDFPEAGLELKCTPLKRLDDDSMVSKERLVLNIIDYLDEAEKSFYTSSFWLKNKRILLMFYLYQFGFSYWDYLFKIIRIWEYPATDLKIIQDDWNKIHWKITHGMAHEISEGDTLFLGACTKGSKGQEDKRKQPCSDILANQRAYAIKSKYLNSIILDSSLYPEMCDSVYLSEKQVRKIKSNVCQAENAVKDVREYEKNETFEQLIERRFSKYYGKTIYEIEQTLNTTVSNSPKAVSYSVCRAILGVKTNKIAEFEKANLQIKTIRLEHGDKINIKESMSFPNIRYTSIINEDEWEESFWYNILVQRFLFIVFKKDVSVDIEKSVLQKVFFWTMPVEDLAMAESFWKDTRDKVRDGDYGHFLRMTQHPICHVRPKAKDSSDLMETPQYGWEKKKCYWLNRKYVLNQVIKNL